MNKEIYERIMTGFLCLLNKSYIFNSNARRDRNWMFSINVIQSEYEDECAFHLMWLKDTDYE